MKNKQNERKGEFFPVLAALFLAFFLLNEHLTITKIVGSIFIIIGYIFLTGKVQFFKVAIPFKNL